MSIRIEDHRDGVITLSLAGKLHQPELAAIQRALGDQLAGGDKVAVLLDAREFEGWAKGGDWSDLDAQFAVDPMIRKMAIVVDPAWETLGNAFTGKGLRRFPIEMFAPADFQKALAWVTATQVE